MPREIRRAFRCREESAGRRRHVSKRPSDGRTVSSSIVSLYCLRLSGPLFSKTATRTVLWKAAVVAPGIFYRHRYYAREICVADNDVAFMREIKLSCSRGHITSLFRRKRASDTLKVIVDKWFLQWITVSVVRTILQLIHPGQMSRRSFLEGQFGEIPLKTLGNSQDKGGTVEWKIICRKQFFKRRTTMTEKTRLTDGMKKNCRTLKPWRSVTIRTD